MENQFVSTIKQRIPTINKKNYQYVNDLKYIIYIYILMNNLNLFFILILSIQGVCINIM